MLRATAATAVMHEREKGRQDAGHAQAEAQPKYSW